MMQAQNNENVPKHPHPCMLGRCIVVGGRTGPRISVLTDLFTALIAIVLSYLMYIL